MPFTTGHTGGTECSVTAPLQPIEVRRDWDKPNTVRLGAKPAINREAPANGAIMPSPPRQDQPRVLPDTVPKRSV